MAPRTRAQRAQDHEARQPDPQLKDFAFNVYGHALEDGMIKGRSENEIILAYQDRSKIKIDKIVEKLEREKADPIYRPSNEYTEREKLRDEVGCRPYLVEGYALRSRDQDSIVTTVDAKAKKQQPVGTKAAANCYEWNEKELPLLVVTEVLDSNTQGTELWALFKPVHGICTPVKIKQELVFYRHEFREASTTTIPNRKTEWNLLVSAQAVRPNFMKAPSEKQDQFKRARDSSKVIVAPNVSFANEILCLARGFEKTKKSWYLKELQLVLEELDEDTNFAPIDHDLRDFTDGDDEFDFDRDQAQIFVDHFNERWPEVRHVTVDRVMSLKKGMVEAGIVLEYRLLRSFVAEGAYRLSLSQPYRGDLKDFVKELVASAERMIPLPASSPSISPFQETSFLHALHVKLQEVVKAGRVFDKHLKDSHGDATFKHDGTPYDIWTHYADMPDTDSAKAAFMALARQHAAALKYKETSMEIMINNILKVMEETALTPQKVGDTGGRGGKDGDDGAAGGAAGEAGRR